MIKIIIEIAIAVVLAYVAILANSKKFKILKEFTQSKRYKEVKTAMIAPFTDQTLKTTAPAGQYYFCHSSSKEWELIISS